VPSFVRNRQVTWPSALFAEAGGVPPPQKILLPRCSPQAVSEDWVSLRRKRGHPSMYLPGREGPSYMVAAQLVRSFL
jgi:hypothetical protein